MRITDYGRAFVTFVTHGRVNNARLQIESVCRLTDNESSERKDYWFFASCKSEDTFAEKDLFYEENYDFCGIFSPDEYIILRTHSLHVDRYREEGLWRERFEDVNYAVAEVEGEVLEDSASIVQASLDNVPLVGQVETESGDGRFKAELEFPIKTMNANDIETIYQVDTGPLPFPEFDEEGEFEISKFSAAYVAYNQPTLADFILQRRHRVRYENEVVPVTHYSKIISVPAITRVIAVR